MSLPSSTTSVSATECTSCATTRCATPDATTAATDEESKLVDRAPSAPVELYVARVYGVRGKALRMRTIDSGARPDIFPRKVRCGPVEINGMIIDRVDVHISGTRLDQPGIDPRDSKGVFCFTSPTTGDAIASIPMFPTPMPKISVNNRSTQWPDGSSGTPYHLNRARLPLTDMEIDIADRFGVRGSAIRMITVVDGHQPQVMPLIVQCGPVDINYVIFEWLNIHVDNNAISFYDPHTCKPVGTYPLVKGAPKRAAVSDAASEVSAPSKRTKHVSELSVRRSARNHVGSLRRSTRK